jgi:hypothetical protein
MIKNMMIIAWLLVAAGCASHTAGVTPVKPPADLPKVQAPIETPALEPIKTEPIVPQKTTATVEQPGVQMPATLKFKKNVSFNHKSHSESFDCIKCHTDKPGKIANFGKDFAHETCKGCHKENGRSVSCSSCHL